MKAIAWNESGVLGTGTTWWNKTVDLLFLRQALILYDQGLKPIILLKKWILGFQLSEGF